MFEEFQMEKKQIRSGQASSKSGPTDAKKTQDVKHFPRGSRRREPPGTSFPAKNDSNRKPTPQRTKAMDKRPKPRSAPNNSGAASGKENSGLTDEGAFEVELESVFVQGSKKQSLNHLLNFHYSSRGDANVASYRSNNVGSHRLLATHKHKYNKEQFLQANCQFVVDSQGDYKVYLNNPDALVDWDLVEQIHVQVSEFPCCPICLYPPVAAKMTRCGHVYCWSCILHYLALSDKNWRKCPICYEAVHKRDLKSVVAMPHTSFNIGDTINFRLMKRAQGSLIPVPVEESSIDRNVLLNISEKNVNTVYSKLLLANTKEVMYIIDREKNELSVQLSNEDNCPEMCFIEEAVSQLKERESNLLSKIQCTENGVCNEIKGRLRSESTTSDGTNASDDVEGNGMVDDLLSPLSQLSTGDSTNNIKHYYFYQASDGQHIYLHSLNIRMLEHTYGSLEKCPMNLNGRILEKEGGSMTEDLRKRLRYLQHMPVTCQFEVAEIQLRPPTITRDTLDNFHDQLEIRKVRRQRRAKDEKRREKKIFEEENRKMGRYAEMDVPIESHSQFPQCGLEDMPPLEPTPSPGPSLPNSLSNENQHVGLSFAKMLTSGKSKPPEWPTLSPKQEPGTRLITVTGPSKSTVKPRVQSDSEPETEDYVRPPNYRQSFSDVIALALEKASVSNATGESSSGGKKKKKNKQKLLFGTSSMVYSGK